MFVLRISGGVLKVEKHIRSVRRDREVRCRAADAIVVHVASAGTVVMRRGISLNQVNVVESKSAMAELVKKNSSRRVWYGRVGCRLASDIAVLAIRALRN